MPARADSTGRPFSIYNIRGTAMEIITIRHHSGEAADPYGGSPDAKFMRSCREVDLNPPATWDAYDLSTEAGAATASTAHQHRGDTTA